MLLLHKLEWPHVFVFINLSLVVWRRTKADADKNIAIWKKSSEREMRELTMNFLRGKKKNKQFCRKEWSEKEEQSWGEDEGRLRVTEAGRDGGMEADRETEGMEYKDGYAEGGMDRV